MTTLAELATRFPQYQILHDTGTGRWLAIPRQPASIEQLRAGARLFHCAPDPDSLAEQVIDSHTRYVSP